jgi:hypothetical protein
VYSRGSGFARRFLDGDACVDHRDLLILLAAVIHRSEEVVSDDFNRGGRVNGHDVVRFMRLFSRPGDCR